MPLQLMRESRFAIGRRSRPGPMLFLVPLWKIRELGLCLHAAVHVSRPPGAGRDGGLVDSCASLGLSSLHLLPLALGLDQLIVAAVPVPAGALVPVPVVLVLLAAGVPAVAVRSTPMAAVAVRFVGRLG